MSEDVEGQKPEPSPSEDTVSPEDFREYEAWRKTGELPSKKPPAAAEKAIPPAKTEPEPGPEKPSEPEEQEEDEEESKDTGERKRPGSRQRRIDKLTRELDELRRVIAGQQQPAPAARPPEKPQPQPVEGKPKLEDFETLEAYQEALTDFKIDQRERARQQEAQRQAVAQYEERLQADWATREKAAKRAHPDYLETIESVEMPKGPIVADLRQAILEEEQGAEILYWLAKNPAEIKRIAALSPHSAVREIGKIAARLPNGIPSTPSTGSDPPKKQVTSATRPPAAVTRSAGSPSEDINDPEVQSDYTRWERLRMAQLRNK